MRKVFENEIWVIGMFTILGLVRICCMVYGTAVDYPAIDMSLGILGVDIILKFYPAVMRLINETIPEDSGRYPKWGRKEDEF